MSEEKKEEAQPPAANPKMILQELEKSAVAPEAVLSELAPSPVPVEPPPVVMEAPLITEAMRRLDDLLARFRK